MSGTGKRRRVVELDEPAHLVDLTERGRPALAELEHDVELLRALVQAIGESDRAEDVYVGMLRVVCRETGWALGQAWVVEGDQLVVAASYSSVHGLDPFLAASRRLRLSLGVGLPGRVWQSAVPAWIRDAGAELSLQRALAAKRLGIGGAFAVPLLAATGPVAVLEFFSLEPREEDHALLYLVADVAAAIGPLFARDRTAGLARAVLDAAGEAIIAADPRDAIVVWNPAAERLFGYTAQEILGKPLNTLIADRSRGSFDRILRTGTSHAIRALRVLGIDAGGRTFTMEATIAGEPLRSLIVRAVFNGDDPLRQDE